MIVKYKTKGDRLTVVGFLMAFGGRLIDVFCGDSAPGMLLVLSGLLELTGGVLFVIGCGFLARAKGHHCAWGLLGLLNLIGYFLLCLCLKDRTEPNESLAPGHAVDKAIE